MLAASPLPHAFTSLHKTLHHLCSRLLATLSPASFIVSIRNTPCSSPDPPTVSPHVGGERILHGSAEEQTLQRWVSRLAALSGKELAAALALLDQPPPAAVANPSPVLRRLNLLLVQRRRL